MDIERRVDAIEAALARLPGVIPATSGGGGGGFIKGTKAEIDARLSSLTAPQIAYATDLKRYYDLVIISEVNTWQAWNFLE